MTEEEKVERMHEFCNLLNSVTGDAEHYVLVLVQPLGNGLTEMASASSLAPAMQLEVYETMAARLQGKLALYDTQGPMQ